VTSVRFSLRALCGLFLLVSILLALMAIGFRTPSPTLVLLGVACRLIAIGIAGIVFGVMLQRTGPAITCAAIGVVIADVVWVVIMLNSELAKEEPNRMLFNPLVLISILSCPPAAATNRGRALTSGAMCSVIPPIIWAVWKLSHLNQFGIGLAITWTIMVLSITAGLTGLVVTRVLWELIEQSTVDRQRKDVG
jgi:hypothetical protein